MGYDYLLAGVIISGFLVAGVIILIIAQKPSFLNQPDTLFSPLFQIPVSL